MGYPFGSYLLVTYITGFQCFKPKELVNVVELNVIFSKNADYAAGSTICYMPL
jgi:hypothetical protein